MIRSERGIGWNWLAPYTGDQSFQWCGAAVATWLAAAGLPLAYRRFAFSSVERIEAWGRFRSYVSTWTHPKFARLPGGEIVALDELHSALGRRLIQYPRPGTPLSWLPQPGDVVLVGPDPVEPMEIGKVRRGEHGRHVALVRSFDVVRGVVETVEGNAGGFGPAGEKIADGCVHATRPLPRGGETARTYHVRTIIRPGLADFVRGVELLERSR